MQGPLLNVGCGTSELSERLHVAGYKDILSVDIDQRQIEMMKKRHSTFLSLVCMTLEEKELRLRVCGH